jgi:hypothetical protein
MSMLYVYFPIANLCANYAGRFLVFPVRIDMVCCMYARAIIEEPFHSRVHGSPTSELTYGQ